MSLKFVGPLKTGHWVKNGKKYNTYEEAMSRGPKIKQEEIDKAHQLKKDGLTVPQIKERLNRSLASVYQMLARAPTVIS